MTRPRSTYTYDDQVVTEGAWRVEFRQTGAFSWSIESFHDGAPVWRESSKFSAQQLFVSDDGRTAVLDAADQLTFRLPDGRITGHGSLLEVVCPGWQRESSGGGGLPVRWSTAGPFWEPYLAATFVPGAPDFVVSGRGVPPFAIDPTSLARTTFDGADLCEVLRRRAPEVLRAALGMLNANKPNILHHGTPWRFAAVGWARVAGETGAHEAVPTLRALAQFDVTTEGATSLPWYPRPADPIDVRRFALDPLRQATRLALLRLGAEDPQVAVMQLAQREGWFSTTWRAFAPPAGHDTQWSHITTGISPSELVNRVGGPTLIDAREDRIWWSYDSSGPDGPRSIDVKWGKKGAEQIVTVHGIPNATIEGRVA
jgi:hypothetical protein